jgi:hypothetical protein
MCKVTFTGLHHHINLQELSKDPITENQPPEQIPEIVLKRTYSDPDSEGSTQSTEIKKVKSDTNGVAVQSNAEIPEFDCW